MEAMMLHDILAYLPEINYVRIKDYPVSPTDFSFDTVAVSIRNPEGEPHLVSSSNPKRFHAKIMELFPKTEPKIIIGEGCNINPTAVIGGEGFGYTYDENGAPEHRRHFAGVTIGDQVSIGAHTCIDRGMLSDTTIGDDTKIDNLVHIAHNCKIGKRCMVVAGAVVCGSVVVGDDCWIGAGARIIQKITIGKNAVIGIGAVVIRDVAPGAVMVGNPARDIGPVKSGRGSKL